jgi:glycerol-3-phosphate dehydrogenase
MRVVFALPYADDFTLIGTTDEPFTGDLDTVAPDGDEITYLCRAVSEFFRARVQPDQVVWAFAGVRSLYDDGRGRVEDVTREYHLALDQRYRMAPLLTVYGGKITTYRRLAEDVLGRLARVFPMKRGWTATAPLPGGDFFWDEIDKHVAAAQAAWPFLGEADVRRMVRAYGTRIERVMEGIKSREDMAPFFGPLGAAEVRYLTRHEWARTADDVLWRRSKLGLRLDGPQKELLARFMANPA